MKAITIVVTAGLVLALPLVAENINGFENFVLSRNDGTSSPPAAIANFSSRTHTEVGTVISHFSSKKPTPLILRVR